MLRQLLFKLQSLIRDDQGRFMDRVKVNIGGHWYKSAVKLCNN